MRISGKASYEIRTVVEIEADAGGATARAARTARS
jgi:hypothetical protein